MPLTETIARDALISAGGVVGLLSEATPHERRTIYDSLGLTLV